MATNGAIIVKNASIINLFKYLNKNIIVYITNAINIIVKPNFLANISSSVIWSLGSNCNSILAFPIKFVGHTNNSTESSFASVDIIPCCLNAAANDPSSVSKTLLCSLCGSSSPSSGGTTTLYLYSPSLPFDAPIVM